MISYEIRKIFSWKIILIALALWIVSVVIPLINFSGIRNGDETGKRFEIGKEYEGKITEAKLDKINILKAEMEETIAKEYDMEQMYVEGKISRTDYMKYRDQYHYYKANQNIIERLYSDINNAKEKNVDYLLDDYYNYFFSINRIPAFLLLFAAAIGMTTALVESKEISNVTTVTLKGKKYVNTSKLVTTFLISAVSAIIFTIPEIILLCRYDGFHNNTTLIVSVRNLSKIGEKIGISIMAYLILWVVFRIVLASVIGVMAYKLVNIRNSKRSM